MMHGNNWDHMGAWGWVGMLIMTLFWFSVLALIIWALIGPRSPRSTMSEPPARGDQAMTLLRERFARSEITAEEYEKARQILEGR